MTVSEKHLWTRLRRRQLGVAFRRQSPVGLFVVDFLSIQAQMVVECDGDQHTNSDYDAMRDDILRSRGLTILRFDNRQIATDIDHVVTVIRSTLKER